MPTLSSSSLHRPPSSRYWVPAFFCQISRYSNTQPQPNTRTHTSHIYTHALTCELPTLPVLFASFQIFLPAVFFYIAAYYAWLCHIYLRTYTHTHVCVCMCKWCVFAYVHVCEWDTLFEHILRIRIYIYIGVCVCICLYVYIYIRICLLWYLCRCICVCMYLCMCAYVRLFMCSYFCLYT